MGSPDRFQLDDHFAAAKARSQAKPAGTIGVGGALAGLVLLAGAIAATWWWALQPATGAAGADAHPLPTSVGPAVGGQAGDAERLDPDGRGPRPGGETSEAYEARLAALRERDAAASVPTAGPQPQPVVDRVQAGRPAPAAGLPAAIAARPAAPPAGAPPAGAPDHSALGLAGRVNDLREDRAAHLRWLDACQRQRLVEVARAAIAHARDATAAHTAEVSAQNLAADIDTHQREARRIDGLVATAEQRLVDYAAAHHQQLPPLENPAETVSGLAAQPRPMPVATTTATIRPAPAGAQRGGNVDPFAQPGR